MMLYFIFGGILLALIFLCILVYLLKKPGPRISVLLQVSAGEGDKS